jgi:signal transduction histidine kinase
MPVVQQTEGPIVLLCGFAFAMGIAGDLASCGQIPLPASWAPLLTSFHYVAIVLAAVGFGYRAGVAAAVLVGFVHFTAGAIVCARSVSQQGDSAAFIIVGLLAGLVTKYAPKRASSRSVPLSMVALGEHDQGAKAPKAHVVGVSQISPSFVQAIRTPLSTIESAVYLWEEAGLTGENHREVAAIILRECHRLDVLAQSLEFVQPRPPAYRQVKLSSLFGEIIRMASPVTEAASITLRKAEGLDLRLICDPDLVEQAVLNLITNAIRIVGQGDEMVLAAHSNKGDAIVEVSHRRAGVLGNIRIPIAATPEG